MLQVASTLRKWVRPLRQTPLHPQWFAVRDERKTRQWVAELAIGRVLDVGCAEGWAREVISRECEYLGLDYPATATQMYQTRPQVFADAARLPLVDGAFDTVLLLEVLEHVAKPECVLAEISRVLKPGGLLLLSVPFLYPLHDAPHDYQRYTAAGLQAASLRAGMHCGAAAIRNPGFQAVAMLAAIACAEGILSATRTRHWRLIFAPLLVLSIPIINCLGWLFSGLGGHEMIATGYAMEVRKPVDEVRR